MDCQLAFVSEDKIIEVARRLVVIPRIGERLSVEYSGIMLSGIVLDIEHRYTDASQSILIDVRLERN